MASLPGLLVGYADAQHQKHLQDTAQALQQKQSIMQLYDNLLQKPEFEDAHPEILQSYLGLASTPTDKLPKAIKQYSDLNTVLGPAMQRAQARQQSQPVSASPVMGSPQNAPAPPPGVSGPPVGMDALNAAVTTIPGQPQAPAPPQIGPPPAQVAAQADSIGAQQGALPGVNTVVPPSAAGASVSPATGFLPPAPVAPISPRWIDPAAWRKYESDNAEYQKELQTVRSKQLEESFAQKQRDDYLARPDVQAFLKTIPPAMRTAIELEMRTGKNLPVGVASLGAPKLQGTSVPGSTAPPGQLDFVGNPIDPKLNYTTRTVNGELEWVPNAAKAPTADEVKEQQIATYYAHLTGVDPASMNETQKSYARKLADIKDDFVQSALEAATAQKKGMLTPQEWQDVIKQTEKAKADNLRPPGASDIGTWTLAEDENGKPVQMNSKTGEIRPVKGVQRSGTFDKKQAADEKANGPARDAIAYADSYLKNGGDLDGDGKPIGGKPKYTGPGDEALMDKFFEVAKPSTGFKMTTPQQNLFMDARSWVQSAKAKLAHITGGSFLDDQQRNRVVATMKQIAAAKAKSTSAVTAPPSDSASPKVQKWGRDAQGNPVPIQ